MQSPFPGMDPYLEEPAFWEDFHRRFITAIADDLLNHLPPQYDAHIDQRVRLIEAPAVSIGDRLPDVAVSGGRPTRTHDEGESGKTVLTTVEPVTVSMPEYEEVRDVWIEIVRRPERSLVTAIEVLSPSNKAGEGAAEYRRKRTELYQRHVSLVELDLLLGGERLRFARPLPSADYYVAVARDARRPIAEIYPWTLLDPLPTIPVPLRPPDPDVPLNLATVFKSAYERGHYATRLQYAGEPPVRLPPDRAAWVRDRARSIVTP